MKVSVSGSLVTDMRIVPLGSEGTILDLDWFINYRYIKLVRKASEIERNDDLRAYCKQAISTVVLPQR